MVCQGSLGLHPMKVKVKNRIGRICNRVDPEHANWLLDRRMDAAYIKITYRRRGGTLGLVVLMMAFLALLWIFAYSTQFKAPITAAAGTFSLVIGIFLAVEIRTFTVGDRMRDMLAEVELDDRLPESPAVNRSSLTSGVLPMTDSMESDRCRRMERLLHESDKVDRRLARLGKRA